MHPTACLHRAGIEIFSALYGRDFFAENQLLEALAIDDMSLDALRKLARDGYSPDSTKPAPERQAVPSGSAG